MQRCYYEVLEVSRRADDEEIRKAYRKAALRWHPDRNVGNEAEANERFKEVQQAYSVLSDPDERAWYDNHRLAILRGEADPAAPQDGKASDDGFNVWAFFTTSVFRGYGDDAGGFYRVYAEAFETITRLETRGDDGFSDDDDADPFAAPDSDSDGLDDTPAARERRRRRQQKRQQRQQQQQRRPAFGTSESAWEDVSAFYASWKGFRTRRSFASRDVFNRSDAPDRRTKRAVDKENRRAREKARAEYSERIRHLVEFVAKLDPRVKAHRAAALQQQLEADARAAQQRAQEHSAAEARRRVLLAERDRALQEEIERLSMELDAEGAFNPFRGGDLYERKPVVVTDVAGDAPEDASLSSTKGKGKGKGKGRQQKKAAVREEEDEEEEEEEDEEPFCAVCNKGFKSKQQLRNHEASKKHKDALRRVMEEVAMEGDEELLAMMQQERAEQAHGGAGDEDDSDGTGEVAEQLGAMRLSKKEKKRRAKMRKAMAASPFGEDEEEENGGGDDEEEEENDAEGAPAAAAAAAAAAKHGSDEEVDGVVEDEAADGLTEKQRKRLQRRQKKEQKKVLQSARAANAAAAAAAYAAAREDEADARSNKRDRRRADARAGPEAAAAGSGKVVFVCGKCGEQFAGRNALFTHLRKTGHAIPL